MHKNYFIFFIITIFNCSLNFAASSSTADKNNISSSDSGVNQNLEVQRHDGLDVLFHGSYYPETNFSKVLEILNGLKNP